MSIGSRLEQLRILNNWTVAEAARQLELVYTTYRGYEKDEREPGHDFLIKAASVYGVTTDYLLGLSDKGPLTKAMLRALVAMRKINGEGQELVADYAEVLLASGKYHHEPKIIEFKEDSENEQANFKMAAYDGEEFSEDERAEAIQSMNEFQAKQEKNNK